MVVFAFATADAFHSPFLIFAFFLCEWASEASFGVDSGGRCGLLRALSIHIKLLLFWVGASRSLFRCVEGKNPRETAELMKSTNTHRRFLVVVLEVIARAVDRVRRCEAGLDEAPRPELQDVQELLEFGRRRVEAEARELRRRVLVDRRVRAERRAVRRRAVAASRRRRIILRRWVAGCMRMVAVRRPSAEKSATSPKKPLGPNSPTFRTSRRHPRSSTLPTSVSHLPLCTKYILLPRAPW